MNIDSKQKAYGTLVLVAIVSLIFWWFSDSFSIWLMNANPFLAMASSLLLNPSYLVLIYILYKQYSYRGIAAGILIALAIDISSLSHSISRFGIPPTDAALYSYSDTTIYKILPHFMHNQFGVFVLYVVIPTLLVYIALRLLRRTASFNKVVKQAI